MVSIARNKRQLTQRLQRFLASPAYGIPQVNQLLSDVSQLGDCAIFGGMLRDLALVGGRGFSSDIDVVLADSDAIQLEQWLCQQKLAFQRNRYGGFAIRLDKWLMDIWALQDTWALQQQSVVAPTFDALLQTTFFSWDAIVYDCSAKQLLCAPNYFDALQQGVVDMNFEPNPNLLGITVRCLRLLVLQQASLSLRLAQFLQQQLQCLSAAEILQREQQSYLNPVVSMARLQRIQLALAQWQGQTLFDSPLRAQQFSLGLDFQQE